MDDHDLLHSGLLIGGKQDDMDDGMSGYMMKKKQKKDMSEEDTSLMNTKMSAKVLKGALLAQGGVSDLSGLVHLSSEQVLILPLYIHVVYVTSSNYFFINKLFASFFKTGCKARKIIACIQKGVYFTKSSATQICPVPFRYTGSNAD